MRFLLPPYLELLALSVVVMAGNSLLFDEPLNIPVGVASPFG